MDVEIGCLFYFQALTFNFYMLYFDFWPSLISSFTLELWYIVSQVLFFDSKFDFGALFSFLVLIVLTFLVHHAVFMWAGFQFVNKKVLERGNMSLLNGFEDGLLLLSSVDARSILF